MVMFTIPKHKQTQEASVRGRAVQLNVGGGITNIGEQYPAATCRGVKSLVVTKLYTILYCGYNPFGV